MPETLGSALAWWAHTKGEEEAIVFEESVLTFRELGSWSGRIARSLADAHIEPGDRVGVYGGNSLEWAAAAIGVIKAGAILVPMNPRLTSAEIGKISDDASLSLVLAETRLENTAIGAREWGATFDVKTFEMVESLRNGAVDDFRIDRAPDEPVSIIFTSGSTGRPKGVLLSGRMLMSIVFQNTLTEEGLRPGAVTIMALPLAFTPGLVYGLLMSTVLGARMILEREVDGSRLVPLIEKHKVTAFFGVPFLFEAVSRSPLFADADLSSIRTAWTGGAAVTPTLLRTWADKGVMVRQIYGATEAGGVSTSTLVSEALEFPDRCGNGSIFTEVRVFGADGTEAAPGELGELAVRGPIVTPGYWNNETATSSAFRDGWFYTGDLGTADDAGRIRFVERSKDLIISGGINISPAEIEIAISDIDGVEEVAVISARDDKFGETPAAIITASRDLEVSEVVAHCERVLSNYKVPRFVVLRSSPLPRLASGKISKADIRDEYKDIADTYDKVR
ncbi:class I adenylate-forming enzyme family protein [Rhodococcus sp. B50]|uniref:class I adenylate-forming enzyme family protein n=1 Tax=Rhodococcus sp. B50 TaxID=2682847 RepID=UPI001BD69E79|nr:AMP-binding protein [Rhodococcus sp. B50]MBS9375039.1 Long-chain-fatty-acid--CoA ligase FadD13 [Rhodococcus sp. B50]